MIVQLYLLDLECTMNWEFLVKRWNISSKYLLFFSPGAISIDVPFWMSKILEASL